MTDVLIWSCESFLKGLWLEGENFDVSPKTSNKIVLPVVLGSYWGSCWDHVQVVLELLGIFYNRDVLASFRNVFQNVL